MNVRPAEENSSWIQDPSPISDGWRGDYTEGKYDRRRRVAEPDFSDGVPLGRVFDKPRLEILQCMSSALPRRNASVTPHGSSMCNLYSITAKQARHYLAFYAGSFDVNAVPWALVCVCPEA